MNKSIRGKQLRLFPLLAGITAFRTDRRFAYFDKS
jgi:hypothetical protein